MKKVLLTLISAILFTFTVSAQNPPDYWPTTEWKHASPESCGVNSELLLMILGNTDFDKLGLHSLVIIRKGYIVAEAYRYPYTRDTRHPVYSVTKSFVSTLIGIALDEGLLDNVSQKVLPFFPGRGTAINDKRKQALSLQDLLTMQSGMEWAEINLEYSDPKNTVNLMAIHPDWIDFVLSQPVQKEPGKTFNYNSGDCHLLTGILNKTTEGKAGEFAGEKLLAPLGITDYAWLKDPEGIITGGWGLAMKTEDMAKLGYLYLHKGEWEGRQIVSRQWVEEAIKPRTVSDMIMNRGKSYGYLWWLMDSDIYSAQGFGGQYIFVFPDKDLVIATTGNIDYRYIPEIYSLLMREIPDALLSDEPIQAAPKEAAELKRYLENLSEPEMNPLPAVPDFFKAARGSKFNFEKNPEGLISLTLTAVRSDEMEWELVQDGGGPTPFVFRFTSGLDNHYRESPADIPWYNGYFSGNRIPLVSRVTGVSAKSVTMETSLRGISGYSWLDTVEIRDTTLLFTRRNKSTGREITVKGSTGPR